MLVPFLGFSQLPVSMYFPEPDKIVELGITQLKEECLWLECEKKDTIIRKDFFNRYNFNHKGQKIFRQKFYWNDSTKVYEKEIFKYDSLGNLIETLETRPWKQIDSSEFISIQITYNQEGQIVNQILNKSYKNREDSIRNKSITTYSWYENGLLIKDSSTTNYDGGKVFARCKAYTYENKLVKTEIILNDSSEYRFKNYYYENERLIKVTINKDGKKEKVVEEYFYDERGNKLKEITYWFKKRIATFEYDDFNRLIAYNPNLKSDIPRNYKFHYNEEGLVSKVITFAPKSNWTHVTKLKYYK